MSRQLFGRAPSVSGRSATASGRDGLVMSTNVVPSRRPTIAHSFFVCASVQPQMSFIWM